MEGMVNLRECLHYSQLNYRQKFYRNVWGASVTLPALIAAQLLGWFPNGAFSLGGLSHTEALGWGLIGLVAITFAVRAAHSYSRWQSGTRREGSVLRQALSNAAEDPST